MARPAAIPAVLSVLLLACGPKPPASSASETPTPGAESEVPSPPAPGENPAGAAPGEQPVVAVPAGKYRVSLSRPEVVGERAQMTRTVSDLTSQRIVEGGKVVKNETMRQHVEFEAVKETLAITPAGHPRRTRYTVQRFEARMGKSMKPIFASGTVLTAQRGSEAEQSVTSSTGPLSKEQLAAVKLVISLRERRAGDQEIFGTAEPRGIGDSWPINSERGKQSMEEEGIAKLRSLTGNTTLVAEREVDSVPCLEIMGRMEADIENLPGLPKDTKVVRGKLRARVSGMFPIDPKLLAPLKTTSMSFEVVTRTTTAKGSVEMHLSTQREGEARLRALK